MSIKVHKGSAPYLFMAQGTNFGTFLTLCQKFAKIKSKVEPADISWNTRTRSVHSCNILLFGQTATASGSASASGSGSVLTCADELVQAHVLIYNSVSRGDSIISQ